MNVKIPSIIDTTLSKLGELSFSMYMFHLMIGYSLMFSLWREKIYFNEAHYPFIVLAITIVFSFFTFNVIEKPFLSLRSKYLK